MRKRSLPSDVKICSKKRRGRSVVTNGTYTISELSSIITPLLDKYGMDSACLFGSYARGGGPLKSDRYRLEALRRLAASSSKLLTARE